MLIFNQLLNTYFKSTKKTFRIKTSLHLVTRQHKSRGSASRGAALVTRLTEEVALLTAQVARLTAHDARVTAQVTRLTAQVA